MEKEGFWLPILGERVKRDRGQNFMAKLVGVSDKSGYEYFTGIEAKNLFEVTRSLAEYVYGEKVKALVLVDRSARPAYVAFKEYWGLVYGKEKTPDIYFINPKGFSNSGDMRVAVGRFKRFMVDDETEVTVRSQSEVTKDFRDAYQNLISDHKKSSVLLFDTCIHTGNTLSSVVKILRNVGFSDLRLGTARDGNVSLPVSFVAESCFRTCYPFGEDRMVEKSDVSVRSTLTKEVALIDHSKRLRQEIKQIVRDYV